MRIFSDVVFILTAILCSIELSSQFDLSPHGASASGVSPGRSSSTPPSKPPPRERSRSPTASFIEPPNRIVCSNGNGYGMDQLPFIRLISIKNPHREFKLRRYNFPVDKGIKVNERRSYYPPVPPKEQIVLATHDVEAFAILTSANTIAGIYKHNPRIKRKGRAKINIESGIVTPLTSDEVDICPVGPNRRILHDFKIVHINQSDTSHPLPVSYPVESSLCERSRSPASRCISPPTRLPSADGKGYGLDQLQYIMLTSVSNPNRGFELRKYTFPNDSNFLLHERKNQFVPMPRQEHIVLSTFSGDVFAILENADYLAGIYVYYSRVGDKVRVKINMLSETTIPMTQDEIKESPVGRLQPILKYFKVQHVHDNQKSH